MTAPLQKRAIGATGWYTEWSALIDMYNTLPERVRDIIGETLVAGTNVTVIPNDPGDTIAISSGAGAGGAALTAEDVRDTVAAFIVGGLGISAIHNDATDKLFLDADRADYVPGDYDMSAWSMDPAGAASSTVPTAGVLYLVRIKVTEPATIASLGLHVATAGTGLANCYASLHGADGARLGVTADQATSWATSGSKDMPLLAPVAVSPGFYYVGLLMGAGSVLAFSRNAASNNVNAFVTANRWRAWSGLTGQTSVPATVNLATASGSNPPFWFAGLKA